MEQYWTPKSLAERTGVSVPTLHFYEKKGLLFALRTAGNQRRYRRDMARRIAFIQAGQRVGISLAEIKATLDQLPEDRTPTSADWAAISQSWTTLLNERIRRLEAMRDKLTSCIQCGCLSLEKCQIYNPNDRAAHNSAHHNMLEP
ncbi:redox-sensitive transcriptional activator SoxR [Cardiobacteriaceae bacterium TAE3-ERU3]|nr:redox-sensitive transcriptional activator SoxR [Cardiobacteriaceae bacterium TAE3-ERU3]